MELLGGRTYLVEVCTSHGHLEVPADPGSDMLSASQSTTTRMTIAIGCFISDTAAAPESTVVSASDCATADTGLCLWSKQDVYILPDEAPAAATECNF